MAEDIVARLRNYDTCNDAAEAADEIERLRRWIFATAVSFAQSGLTFEEYNAITRDVVSAMGGRAQRSA